MIKETDSEALDAADGLFLHPHFFISSQAQTSDISSSNCGGHSVSLCLELKCPCVKHSTLFFLGCQMLSGASAKMQIGQFLAPVWQTAALFSLLIFCSGNQSSSSSSSEVECSFNHRFLFKSSQCQHDDECRFNVGWP